MKKQHRRCGDNITDNQHSITVLETVITHQLTIKKQIVFITVKAISKTSHII